MVNFLLCAGAEERWESKSLFSKVLQNFVFKWELMHEFLKYWLRLQKLSSNYLKLWRFSRFPTGERKRAWKISVEKEFSGQILITGETNYICPQFYLLQVNWPLCTLPSPFFICYLVKMTEKWDQSLWSWNHLKNKDLFLVWQPKHIFNILSLLFTDIHNLYIPAAQCNT